MDAIVEATEAIRFVEEHGIVLESADGPAPNLVHRIAGEPLGGSWWGHPKGEEILAATRAVRSSRNVLVCRLLNGKITYVHRRLWPALVRLAELLPKERLARVREVHTSSGKHVVREEAFPEWVPPDARAEAEALTAARARAQLGSLSSELPRAD